MNIEFHVIKLPKGYYWRLANGDVLNGPFATETDAKLAAENYFDSLLKAQPFFGRNLNKSTDK